MLGRVVGLLVLALAVGAVPADAGPASAGERDTARPAVRAGAASIGDPYFPLDGNGGIDVQHYDVRDAYDLATGVLHGRTRLRLLATDDLTRFNLDFLLPVSSVQVGGRAATFDRRAGHELRITPRRPLRAGRTYTVRVDYRGVPAQESYLGQRNWLADDGEVVTVNQPHMAPWWFPANDHPRDKATMDVRITLPRRHQVVSNGVRVDRTVRGRLATTHWRSAEPMAPYAAFFVAGDLEVRRGVSAGRPWLVAVSRRLRSDVRRSAMRAMLQTPSLTRWLETQLGPYPFATTGGVVTSLNPGFALETQTRPVYPAVGPGATGLMVHELAHQWFGNSVAISRWRDIVLSEGLATFMEVRWQETRGGDAGVWLEEAYEGRRDDASFWSLRLDDPGPRRIFDDAVYVRGAMSMQALRNRVGESAFWEVLRTWAGGRAGRSATVPEFVAHAESITGEQLDGFFEAWWSSPARPARTAENGLASAP